MKTSGKTRVLRIGIYEWRVYRITTAAVHTKRQTSRVELNASARPWRIIFKLLTGYEENQNLIIPTGKKEGEKERVRESFYRFVYTARQRHALCGR